MRDFDGSDEAMEYAHSLHKNESEVAWVAGKRSLICDTCIPLETRFREPIEESVREFLKELGFQDEVEIDDIAASIGADISYKLMNKIEEDADVKILCNYSSY